MNSFSDISNKNTNQIRGNDLNCNSKMLVYLVHCKKYKLQYYVMSALAKFHFRFNDYKCNHQKFNFNQSVSQESFYIHFKSPNHKGMDDLEFTLIDQNENIDSLRRRESF